MKYRTMNRTAATTAVAAGLCLSLTGCLEGAPTLELPGYVEADITAVATPVAGTLVLLVQRLLLLYIRRTHLRFLKVLVLVLQCSRCLCALVAESLPRQQMSELT